LLRQTIRFDEERFGIDDHAVAEHAGLATMHDSRRKQVQDKRLIADLDRVAGVVSALIASNDVETLGEQIDDLAFTFVAPLGAYHCYDFCHGFSPIKNGSPRRVRYIFLQQLPRNYRLTFRCAESFATLWAAHKSKGLRVFFQAKRPLRTVQT